MDTAQMAFIALQVLSLAIACASLYCFVRVFLAMRENGEGVLATFCLVTLLLVGIGGVVAFGYGIFKSREWEITPIMMLWGACSAVNLVLLGALLAIPV
jgi:hypothetical protein